MPPSFWGFVTRLFGGERARRAPAARAPAPVASRRESPALHTARAFDVTSGAEYPPGDRKELTDDERLRLEALRIRVIDRFQSEKLEIPAFPSRAAQMLRMLEDPDFDIGQLVQIAQRDPMISASVLRAANSAAFAGVTRIESVRDAVLRLGAQTVAAVATAVTARGLFEEGAVVTRSRFGDSWGRLWLHSVTTAFGAGSYATTSRKGDLEQCFLGGMLHDIGKSVALRVLGAMSLGSELRDALSPPLLAALLEAVHVELGRAVAVNWNLPGFVIDACANHHRAPGDGEHALNVIRVVSGLDDLSTNPQFRHGLEEEIRRAAATLGMDGYMLRAVASERRAAATKAAAL